MYRKIPEAQSIRGISQDVDEVFSFGSKIFIFIYNEEKKIGDAAVFSWRTIKPDKLNAFICECKSMLLSSKIQAKIIGSKFLIEKAVPLLQKQLVELVKVIEVENSFKVHFVYHHRISYRLAFVRYERKDLDKLLKDKVIKLLVVDDSPTIHKILDKIFLNDPKIKIVGNAYNAEEVEALVEKTNPDVISLDMYLPGKSGLELARDLLPINPLPIIILSSLEAEDGGPILQALDEGCCDYIQKPTLENLSQLANDFREKVIAAAQVSPVSIIQKIVQKHLAANSIVKPAMGKVESIILLGASTGGTSAITKIFSELPENIPPILVVQHMPAVFTNAFANRLHCLSRFTVVEATDGQVIKNNCVFIAPGGKQMKIILVGDDWKISLTDDAPMNRFKPSVDFLFNSFTPLMYRKLGGRVLGVLLTGMGTDGAKGMKYLRDQGVHTIAQDEASCVVYGMPRAAVELNAVSESLSLEFLANHLVKIYHKFTKA